MAHAGGAQGAERWDRSNRASRRLPRPFPAPRRYRALLPQPPPGPYSDRISRMSLDGLLKRCRDEDEEGWIQFDALVREIARRVLLPAWKFEGLSRAEKD